MMSPFKEGPPPASPKFQKTEFGGESPGSLPHFRFLKTGRYSGGQFGTENDFRRDKTVHSRIVNKFIFLTLLT